jgi:hypothetical protein
MAIQTGLSGISSLMGFAYILDYPVLPQCKNNSQTIPASGNCQATLLCKRRYPGDLLLRYCRVVKQVLTMLTRWW